MTAALRVAASGCTPPVTQTSRGAHRWSAQLALAYERRGARTVMSSNAHSGPLVVQKSLYPEGDAVCQTVILHPPGGIAGGDQLVLDVKAGANAAVQLTTPGATKWYKANGRDALQSVRLAADTEATLEWLPLESIVYDGAMASSSIVVDLAGTACALGWDIVAFGRSASGERFEHGHFGQTIELRRDGELLWAEYGEVRGGDPLLASAIGYDGRTVSGLLWLCTSETLSEESLAACREACRQSPEAILCGVTSLPRGVVLARCLCDSTEAARACLTRVWSVLRPVCSGRAAIPPRIWST